MDDQVTKFLQANALVRVEFLKNVGAHESGERGVMAYAKAKALIERGIVRALEVGRDGGPFQFFASAPIAHEVKIVE